jgi:hypothetical protein
VPFTFGLTCPAAKRVLQQGCIDVRNFEELFANDGFPGKRAYTPGVIRFENPGEGAGFFLCRLVLALLLYGPWIAVY